MGIFSRLRTLIASNINHAISQAEKPEKMLNQLLIDLNEKLVESKKAVAVAIADEKKLCRDTQNQKVQSDEWQRKAELAVRAGDDSLAKEALLRKQEYDNYHLEYNKQWLLQKEAVEKLKISLRELQVRIDDAQRKKNMLVARAKRAEAQNKIQATIAGIDDGKASFATFERMEEKVDRMEAEADAAKEIAELNDDTNLEKKFAALEKSDSSADALLADLKSKMGALPPPS
ncbi:MAG: PspA/IM30 family protein [Spirochaetaceae bacterium]|jgi:phage shock protein A|nr:PspA/IM30 family protein [Spirochaetaceae bacterium]GMO14722.1 MAG: PspA/IM30 family protein [Termitinemataceae bacterium]